MYYVLWSDTSKVEGWGRGEVLLRETLDRQAPGTGQSDCHNLQEHHFAVLSGRLGAEASLPP